MLCAHVYVCAHVYGCMLLKSSCFAELEWQREAKEKRERSPWGQEHAMPDQASTFASPVDSVQQEDVDMDEAQSPDRGHTGYISTDPNASFHFEPPRAPVHQGVSGDSPPDGHYGSYQSAYGYPQWSSSSLGGMGHMGSMGHMPLQHSQSMYDPFGSQLSLQQPRMQQLVMEHMQSGSNSQSPDTAEHWYNVPFDEGQKQAPAQDQQRAAEQTLARGLVGQAVQGSVAVRDSNTDFDADTAWSDDDVPPPLPAEPAPPLPVSPCIHVLPLRTLQM